MFKRFQNHVKNEEGGIPQLFLARALSLTFIYPVFEYGSLLSFPNFPLALKGRTGVFVESLLSWKTLQRQGRGF